MRQIWTVVKSKNTCIRLLFGLTFFSLSFDTYGEIEDFKYIPNDMAFQRYTTGNPHQEGLFMLKMPEAWAIERGNKEVVIAVIDWAFDVSHPDLKNKLWINLAEVPDNGLDDDENGYIDDVYGWDFEDNDNTLEGTQSVHGNFVAGIIGAETNNRIGISGMAPNCPLMLIKGGEPGVMGEAKTHAEAIRYAVDNGAKVICKNHFLWEFFPGYSVPVGSELKEACDYAYQKGVLIFSVSGENDGIFRPAVFQTAYDSVIGTGPSDIFEGKLSDFAGGSHFIEVIAPGGERGPGLQSKHNYRSVYSCGTGEKYLYYSGNCFATPHVTGLAALVLSHYPEVDHEQVRQIVRNTAKFNGKREGYDYKWGNGIIDPVAALSLSSEQIAALPVLISRNMTHVTQGDGAQVYPVKVKNNGVLDARVEISLYQDKKQLNSLKAVVKGFETKTVGIPVGEIIPDPGTVRVEMQNLGIARPHIYENSVDMQLYISDKDISVYKNDNGKWVISVIVHNNGNKDAHKVAVILYQNEPSPKKVKETSSSLACSIIEVPAQDTFKVIFPVASIPEIENRRGDWGGLYQDWFKTRLWVEIENLEVGAPHVSRSAGKAKLKPENVITTSEVDE